MSNSQQNTRKELENCGPDKVKGNNLLLRKYCIILQ